MVSNIDLKPLTEETIQQMGYQAHELWLVKIDSVVFGPFETESLKHYVHDNEHLFEVAEASRTNEKEWRPFWAHTQFERRKTPTSGLHHEGPFWILKGGLKVGPLSFQEIDKKIEMGILGMTDHISTDNGESWPKIYEIRGFDRRSHSPEELPVAPAEVSFQRAKLALVGRLSSPIAKTDEALADMAFQGQQLGKEAPTEPEDVPAEEIAPIEVLPQSQPSFIKYGALAAITCVLALGIYFNQDEDTEVVETSPAEMFAPQRKSFRSARGSIPTPLHRAPASVGYQNPSPTTYESRYPTHVETHDQFPEPSPEQERDPSEGPVTETDQPPQEHSLVSNNNSEDNSLDAAMNGDRQQTAEQQPVVQEASDF